MKKILVTGASGFIGQSICKTLSKKDRAIYGVVRANNLFLTNNNVEYQLIRNISPKTKWKDILFGIDCIIHCAGKTQKMNSDKDFDTYQLINSESTKQLAEQAAEAGVKRLIFLSTIKVNGENSDKTHGRKVFKNNDLPNPQSAYAKSKLEAEKALLKISSRTGLEVTIIRLPLVYGHGAKGNLARLIKFAKSGIPFPLSMIKNRRSMISIDNLVDLLNHCIDHPEASGKTFLVSDGEDLSTPELIKLIASLMDKRVYLFPLPIFLLKFLGSIFGKREEINRLVGSLRIDNSYTKKILNWTPPLSVEEGIRRMVQSK